VLGSSAQDRGARDYLRNQGLTLVECSDLATGRDVDTPPT
jgi:molybdenum cofactor cytidylyltransferase/nicotine blue oxidoreductase